MFFVVCPYGQVKRSEEKEREIERKRKAERERGRQREEDKRLARQRKEEAEAKQRKEEEEKLQREKLEAARREQERVERQKLEELAREEERRKLELAEKEEREQKERERIEKEKQAMAADEEVDDDEIIMNATEIIDDDDETSQDIDVGLEKSPKESDVKTPSVEVESPKKSSKPSVTEVRQETEVKAAVAAAAPDDEPIRFRRLARTASKTETSHKKSTKWSTRLKDDTSGLVSSSQLKDIVPDIRNILEEAEVPEEKTEIAEAVEVNVEETASAGSVGDDGEVVEAIEVVEEDVADPDESKPEHDPIAQPVPNENGDRSDRNGVVDQDKPKPLSASASASASASSVVEIKNLVRPFTEKQLRELLQRTGVILEGRFWIDRIKSHAILQVSSAFPV